MQNDAPELTADFFKTASWSIGDEAVASKTGAAAMQKAIRGRPKSAAIKKSLTVRYDADIVAAFKTTGPGWQRRMNDALREWLQSHPQGCN